MHTMKENLEKNLGPTQTAFWKEALERTEQESAKAIPQLFPSLARRIGTGALGGGIVEEDVAEGGITRVDLDAWRCCDAAGHLLLLESGADSETLIDLYLHGDLEERVIALRCLGLFPLGGATVRLLEEAQRSNMESHFRAAVCDSNLVVRATELDDFGLDGFNRTVLKAAFLGLPMDRILDVTTRANPELSRMLQDLASEREAAGRSVWSGTNLLIAYAPTDGSEARIIGGLEHGDDSHRLAAAQGLLVLNRRDLDRFARDRIAREPRPEIRAALERTIHDSEQ